MINYLTAVREGNRLKLYVDGRLVAESSTFNASDYDLSTPLPVRIGFGQTDYFHGRLSEVRAYNRALTASEIRLHSATWPIN